MRQANPGETLVPAPLATSPDRVTPMHTAKKRRLHKRVENMRAYPNRTNGAVFFRLPGNGPDAGDYACSGTAVRSPSRSLVWTAGHCVFDPGVMGAGYATDWEFVPGYGAGKGAFTTRQPYGEWPASSLMTTRRWHGTDLLRGGDSAFDLGVAIVSPRAGRSLQDRVGARRIAFDQSRQRVYSAFGYPRESPPRQFDGRHLFQCRSPYRGADRRVGPPAALRISCDLTGGASGGAWVVRRQRRGYVVSVTSYGYDQQPNSLYGPYQGNAARSLWLSAGG
jgi:hypothetical protein